MLGLSDPLVIFLIKTHIRLKRLFGAIFWGLLAPLGIFSSLRPRRESQANISLLFFRPQLLQVGKAVLGLIVLLDAVVDDAERVWIKEGLVLIDV